jgi:cell division septum initiation protein DivIVA
MNRFTQEQLTDKAEKMQKFLNEQSNSEPNDIIERLEKLNILVSQSGKMLADAKYYKDTVVNGAIMQSLQQAYNEKLSTTTINKFVETAAKEQSYLVNWIDEINSAAGKQLDSLRSILSYRKEEMKII